VCPWEQNVEASLFIWLKNTRKSWINFVSLGSIISFVVLFFFDLTRLSSDRQCQYAQTKRVFPRPRLVSSPAQTKIKILINISDGKPAKKLLIILWMNFSSTGRSLAF